MRNVLKSNNFNIFIKIFLISLFQMSEGKISNLQYHTTTQRKYINYNFYNKHQIALQYKKLAHPNHQDSFYQYLLYDISSNKCKTNLKTLMSLFNKKSVLWGSGAVGWWLLFRWDGWTAVSYWATVNKVQLLA